MKFKEEKETPGFDFIEQYPGLNHNLKKFKLF